MRIALRHVHVVFYCLPGSRNKHFLIGNYPPFSTNSSPLPRTQFLLQILHPSFLPSTPRYVEFFGLFSVIFMFYPIKTSDHFDFLLAVFQMGNLISRIFRCQGLQDHGDWWVCSKILKVFSSPWRLQKLIRDSRRSYAKNKAEYSALDASRVRVRDPLIEMRGRI